MRRYLKLSMLEAQARDIMSVALAEMPNVSFSAAFVPLNYPEPGVHFGLVRRIVPTL